MFYFNCLEKLINGVLDDIVIYLNVLIGVDKKTHRYYFLEYVKLLFLS